MDPLLITVMLISFLTTLIIIPKWIRRAHAEGLTGRDMHKLDKREVAEAGGIGILGGFIIGVFLYLALNTFYFHDQSKILEILGLLGVLFFASLVGVVDDLLGWKRGLNKKIRILMILFAAVPLMVLNVGESTMLGIHFGIFYPLLLIPLGVVGATTTFNFLAGYNGLETGQGIIILAGLTVATFLTGNPWLSIVALCMIASLAAFYTFNKYPAKIFPGDMMTYAVGALIACIAILGSIEKIAIFFFIPYFLETLLKLRGKLKKESFAKVKKDGSLELPYDKIYGLEHLAIWVLKKLKPNKKVYERDVSLIIHAFTILVILIGFLIFF